ncbi:thioesterase domain-containing protein [Nonomuraea sp. NPDC050790]|uniref:thioesterase domain-containing protein n=1 Tax=Nonomuraea sp. NPDC050790 TaxID=3364371 RepID=UPI0037B70AF3
MYCLPYAGGGASAYTGLLRELAGRTDLTVVPVQLPGRENRIVEPPAFTVAGIADELAPGTAEPYALYGHSMGARLAFEVVRELRRRGLPGPSRLYVGGAHPPDRRVPLAAAVDLPDDAFIDQLVRRAGALLELKHLPELRELMMPVLRSDFAWIKNYRYAPEPPFDSPIVAFTGLEDGEVGVAEMLGWARHTTAGFRLRTLRGGHLFVQDQAAELASLIAADLTNQPTPPEPGEHTPSLTGGHDLPEQSGHASPPVGGHILPKPGGPTPSEAGGGAVPEVDELRLWLGRAADHDAVVGGYAGRAVTGVSHSGGLSLVAAVAAGGPGVGVSLLRALDLGADLAELSRGEREQIEDAAEEDRRWLTLRAVTAKRALAAADGQGGDLGESGFPDLADPGPWRVQCDPGLERLARWLVVHLPLHTARGEALAAVAAPYDVVRLGLDMPAEDAG